jgi:hypothetical protein
MPRTPNREPGELVVEAIRLDPAASAGGAGTIRYVDGKLLGGDSNGAYDIRYGQINEAAHEALHTLTHQIARNCYTEVTRVQGRLQSIVIWETAARLKKIRETIVTRTDNKVTTVVINQYNSAGTLLKKITQSVTRSPTTGQVTALTEVIT